MRDGSGEAQRDSEEILHTRTADGPEMGQIARAEHGYPASHALPVPPNSPTMGLDNKGICHDHRYTIRSDRHEREAT